MKKGDNLQETRGRPKNKAFESFAADIEKWHLQKRKRKKSVSAGPMSDANIFSNVFRNSTAYRELQKKYGRIFTLRVYKETSCVVAGYLKGDK